MSVHSENIDTISHQDYGITSPFSYWISRNKPREKSLQELDHEYENLKKEFKTLYGDERTLHETEYATSYYYNYPSLISERMQPHKYRTVMSEINYSLLVKLKGKRFARSILFSNSQGENTREHLENNKIMKILANFVIEPWTFLKRDYINKIHPKFLQFLCNDKVPRRTPTISKYLYLIFTHLYFQRYHTEIPKRLKDELKTILRIKNLGTKKKLELEKAGVISKIKLQNAKRAKSQTIADDARALLKKMTVRLPPNISIKDLVIGVSDVMERYKITLKGCSQEAEALAFFTLLHFLKGLPLPSRPTLLSLLLDLPKNDPSVNLAYRKIVYFCDSNPYLLELNSSSRYTRLPIEEIYLRWSVSKQNEIETSEIVEMNFQRPVIQEAISVNDCFVEGSADMVNILTTHGLGWIPKEVLPKLFTASDPNQFAQTASYIENLRTQRRFQSAYSPRFPSPTFPKNQIEFRSIPDEIIESVKGAKSLTYFSHTPDIDVAFLSFVRHYVVTEGAVVYSEKFSPKFLRSFFPPLLVDPVIKNMVSEIPTSEEKMVIILDECKNHNSHPYWSLCRKINQYPELVVSHQLTDRIKKGSPPEKCSEIMNEMQNGRTVIVEQRNTFLENLMSAYYGGTPWRVSSLIVNLAYFLLVFGSKGGKILLNPNQPNNSFFEQYSNGFARYSLNKLMTSENLHPMQLVIGGEEVIAFYVLQIIQLRILQKKHAKSSKQPIPPIFFFFFEEEFTFQIRLCGIRDSNAIKKKLGIRLIDPSTITSITDFLTLVNAFLSPLPSGSILVFPSFHRILQDEYVPDQIRKMNDEEYYSYLWDLAENEVTEFDTKREDFVRKELNSFIDETTSEREIQLFTKEAEEKFQIRRNQLIQAIDARIRAAVITRSYHQSKGIFQYSHGNYSEDVKVRLFQVLQNMVEKTYKDGIFVFLGCMFDQFFKIGLEQFIPNPGSFLPGFNDFDVEEKNLVTKERYFYLTERLFLDIIHLQKDLLSNLSTYSFVHLTSHKDRVTAYLKVDGKWTGEIWNMAEVYRYLRKLEG